MSFRCVDFFREMASRLPGTWDTLRKRALRGGISPVVFQQSLAELGEEWAQELYETLQEKEVLVMDDMTELNDRVSSDRFGTERGAELTLNGLILLLADMRDRDTEAGGMRVVFKDGSAVSQANVRSCRESAVSDDDYVVVLL